MKSVRKICAFILCLTILSGQLPVHTITAFAAESQTSRLEILSMNKTVEYLKAMGVTASNWVCDLKKTPHSVWGKSIPH